jgi:hypothetical protein
MDLCCSVYLLIFPQNICLPLSLLVYEFGTGKANVPVLKLIFTKNGKVLERNNTEKIRLRERSAQ